VSHATIVTSNVSFSVEKKISHKGGRMPILRNPPVSVTAIDVAMWLAAREDKQLMARIESSRSSANQRAQALFELAVLSRQLVLMLTDSIVDQPEPRG
jgi:hypothetical protein